jgi:5'-nucleotidase
LGACGSSSSDSSKSDASTTTAAPKTLKIVVTNDDGYDSDGLNAITEALRAQPNVEVTVVAPATQQSGKGGTVTGGTLSATDLKTKGGYPVKAVAGTPAEIAIVVTLHEVLDAKAVISSAPYVFDTTGKLRGVTGL